MTWPGSNNAVHRSWCQSPEAQSRSTRRLSQKLRLSSAISAIEVNISCPNVEDRGMVFACDPDASAAVIEGVRRHTTPGVPVFAKLSPDVTDIVSIAHACVDAGADGLSLINTLLGVVIDTETMRPQMGGITGGLVGTCDSSGGSSRGLAGASCASRGSDHRNGWHSHRRRCAGVHPRWRVGDPSRHQHLQRPERTGSNSRRAAAACWERADLTTSVEAVGYAHRPVPREVPEVIDQEIADEPESAGAEG